MKFSDSRSKDTTNSKKKTKATEFQESREGVTFVPTTNLSSTLQRKRFEDFHNQ